MSSASKNPRVRYSTVSSRSKTKVGAGLPAAVRATVHLLVAEMIGFTNMWSPLSIAADIHDGLSCQQKVRVEFNDQLILWVWRDTRFHSK